VTWQSRSVLPVHPLWDIHGCGQNKSCIDFTDRFWTMNIVTVEVQVSTTAYYYFYITGKMDTRTPLYSWHILEIMANGEIHECGHSFAVVTHEPGLNKNSPPSCLYSKNTGYISVI
jgi:hypothetical protein